MILHCTQKLAGKLPEVSAAPLAETSLLGGWHGNLYQIDRRQCVLFCHDETRYMLFLPGLKKAHFEDLARLHRDLFLMSLAAHGVSDAKIMRTKLALGPLACDRVTDRSVLSSMNVAMGDLYAYLQGVPNLLEIDPAAAALHLNDRAVGIRGKYVFSGAEMIARVERL
ncbi:MAG: hypothetical protein WDA20_08145 [Desulfuromonadales bacterium]